MKRYLRTLQLFWGTSIAAEMEYRLNFVMAAITSVGSLAGGLFGLFLFYRQGYEFAGWPWESALLVLAVFTILEGFSRILLIPNLNKIVTQIQQGTLDFVLLKPIGSQFWLSTRSFSPWGLPDVALGGIMLGYAGNRLHLPWYHYVWGIFPLISSFAILYSIWFILGSMSIWFVKIYNVTEVLRGILEAGRYPMAAYPAAYRVFFTFVVPIAFLTTVPAEAFLGKSTVWWILGTATIAVGLLLVSHYFWQFALRFYTSASS